MIVYLGMELADKLNVIVPLQAGSYKPGATPWDGTEGGVDGLPGFPQLSKTFRSVSLTTKDVAHLCYKPSRSTPPSQAGQMPVGGPVKRPSIATWHWIRSTVSVVVYETR
jgi:hypothetical protein